MKKKKHYEYNSWEKNHKEKDNEEDKVVYIPTNEDEKDDVQAENNPEENSIETDEDQSKSEKEAEKDQEQETPEKSNGQEESFIPLEKEKKKESDFVKKEVVFPEHQGLIHQHIGFGTRILILLFFAFLTVLLSIYFLYKAFSYNHKEAVTYNEQSMLNYQVCLKENDFYNSGCLEEDMEYVSMLIDKIPISFQYSSNYTKEIPYKYQYYIVGKVKIYDKDDSSKVLYKNQEVLSEKQELSGVAPGISFTTDITIDYQKYDSYVSKYKDRYSLNSGAALDVTLMIEENAKAKAVGTVTIPLSNQTFSIKKEPILKNNQTKIVEENSWNIVNYIFVLLGVIFVLIVFAILIRIARLLYKISGKTSKYQTQLNHILREFDRIIVVSKDKYRFEEEKIVIKVDSFEELLDARDTLQKPIVYVKVNNIKSEFYVEDDHRVYQYTMKEADFE